MRKYKRYVIITLGMIMQLTATASTADSLRNILPTLKGEDKTKAYEQLYHALDGEGDINAILTCLDEWIAYEGKQANTKYESNARWMKIITLTNYAEDSLLLVEAPLQMNWFMHHDKWEHYYDTWDSKVNVYLYSGRVQAALREAQTILSDATSRDNSFGRALAYQLMGIIYESIGQYEQAIEVFSKCIAQLKNGKYNTEVLTNAYDYLCQTLDEHGDYKRELTVAKEWEEYLQTLNRRKHNQINTRSSIYIVYLCSKASALTGLKRYHEAEQALKQAEEIQAKENVPIGQYRIYWVRAHHALAMGKAALAQDYLNKLRQLDINAGGDTQFLQADIFMKLGKSEEAANIYRTLYFSKDSVYTREMRMQLDELNTLYKVNELEMQSQLERSHYLIGIAVLIVLGMLLFTIFRYRAILRLEREHEKLLESNDKLEKSYKELKVANAKAEESSKMKTNFIQQISHEIRTPLNILSGFTQVITTSGADLDEATRKDVNLRITENTNRITELVNKMLELSDVTSSTIIECNDEVPPLQIAAQAADDARVTQANDIHFDLHYDPEVEHIILHTNLQQATRVLVLLLDNAKKFRKKDTPDTSILVRLSTSGQRLLFAVEDTGIGIPPKEAQRIFEDFVQLDDYYDGTGIGLTVARSIARRLGGDVILDTSYKDGACFLFTLPLS